MTTSRKTRYANSEICTDDWIKCIQIFVGGTERKEDHLEGLGVRGRTNVK